MNHSDYVAINGLGPCSPGCELCRAEANEPEPCWYCEKDIAEGAPRVGVFEVDGPEWAHASCAENANEKAYDRMVEDFYGSSSPQTAEEHFRATEGKR